MQSYINVVRADVVLLVEHILMVLLRLPSLAELAEAGTHRDQVIP